MHTSHLVSELLETEDAENNLEGGRGKGCAAWAAVFPPETMLAGRKRDPARREEKELGI